MKSQNNNRNFKVNGTEFTIALSNRFDYKWQALMFNKRFNAWVRTSYYSNTQIGLKELVKENYAVCHEC